MDEQDIVFDGIQIGNDAIGDMLHYSRLVSKELVYYNYLKFMIL